jgi:hypothetical protein
LHLFDPIAFKLSSTQQSWAAAAEINSMIYGDFIVFREFLILNVGNNFGSAFYTLLIDMSNKS